GDVIEAAVGAGRDAEAGADVGGEGAGRAGAMVEPPDPGVAAVGVEVVALVFGGEGAGGAGAGGRVVERPADDRAAGGVAGVVVVGVEGLAEGGALAGALLARPAAVVAGGDLVDLLPRRGADVVDEGAAGRAFDVESEGVAEAQGVDGAVVAGGLGV